jgi:hypothetical protein
MTNETKINPCKKCGNLPSIEVWAGGHEILIKCDEGCMSSFTGKVCHYEDQITSWNAANPVTEWPEGEGRPAIAMKFGPDDWVTLKCECETPRPHRFEDGMIVCLDCKYYIFAKKEQNPVKEQPVEDEANHTCECACCWNFWREKHGATLNEVKALREENEQLKEKLRGTEWVSKQDLESIKLPMTFINKDTYEKDIKALREENEKLKEKLKGMEWVYKTELAQVKESRNHWARIFDQSDKISKEIREENEKLKEALKNQPTPQLTAKLVEQQVVLTRGQWDAIKNRIIKLESTLSRTKDVAEGLFGVTNYEKIHKHEITDWLESIGIFL